MKATQLATFGGPADVCWHNGRIVVVFQDGPGPDAQLVQRSYTPQGAVLTSVTYPLGSDVGAFPRLLSAFGSLWCIYREGKSKGGQAVLLRDGREVWRSPVECGGNDPCVLGVDGVAGPAFAWQKAPTNEILNALCQFPAAQLPDGTGRPTGLSHFDVSGRVVLVDDARAAQSGMTRPSWAGALVAGEHPDSGVLVRAGDGREARIWPGEESVAPRMAHDANTGTYSVVTSGVRAGRDYGVRLAVFAEADLALPAPAPAPTWADAGTAVDCAPFFDVQGSTIPRTSEDGQVWQCHRRGDELHLVKGATPTLVEVLRLTPDDVRLAYDATDGRFPRAWRLDVTGDGRSDVRWCRNVSEVGWTHTYAAQLVRRSEGGPSTTELFPFLVGLEAHGQHIDYGGDVGVVDAVLVTRFEPQAGRTQDGYHERHHWARRAGRALGLVRYEEVRRGQVVRSFTFNRYAPAQHVEPSSLVILTIPDAPATPTPVPETPTMKTRDQFFAEFERVNKFYAAEDGLQRSGGMVIDGAADVVAMRQWGYDLMAGATADQIIASIKQSEEWKTKHPSQPQEPSSPFL